MTNKKAQSVVFFYIIGMLICSLLLVFIYAIQKEFIFNIEKQSDRLEVQNSFFNGYSRLVELSKFEGSQTSFILNTQVPYRINISQNSINLTSLNRNYYFNYFYSNLLIFCEDYELSSTQNISYFFNGTCIKLT